MTFSPGFTKKPAVIVTPEFSGFSVAATSTTTTATIVITDSVGGFRATQFNILVMGS
jgi:competence transcription factor ComK